MKGLSSTALQKTTSLEAPTHWRSAVSSEHSRMTSAMRKTASMLMPALVEPTFTEAQTRSVTESALGMLLMRRRSASAMPFWTRAEKPPTKSTPTSFAARSMATAMGVRSSASVAAARAAMGVTEMRLLMMGMPYSLCSCSAVGTRFSAAVVRRS